MDFDLLIRRGLLADGSGASLREADVGIVRDRIEAVGDLADRKGAEEIDAKGMVVAPGFIDIHGHSDYFILVEPTAPNKLLQGVTTEIGGNCGYCAAPISDELNEERTKSLDKNFGLRPDWKTLNEYYKRLEVVKPAINFGVLAGHNTIRASVMGGDARPPDEDEKNAMLDMIRGAMEEGALGISTGLIYPPACFADEAELAAVCKPVAKSGGFFATHMRSEGHDLLESIEEVIGAAEKARIRLQISHLKTSGPKNWHKIDDAIGLIEAANARGMDVRCDRYPYTASFTGLSAVMPSWVFEGSRDEYRKRLTQPEIRTRLTEEILNESGADYLDRVVIAQTFSEETHQYEGKSLTEAARMMDKNTFEFLYDLLAGEVSDPTAVYHTMSEDNMTRILDLPYTSIGSDSAARAPEGPLGLGKPHPRAYGTFPRTLRLVREKKIMSIEEAIKKMTALPAQMVPIDRRGEIKTGWFADIVIFDPDKIADTATYDNPHQFPEGIEHVIVNGAVAVSGGEMTGAREGKVIRRL